MMAKEWTDTERLDAILVKARRLYILMPDIIAKLEVHNLIEEVYFLSSQPAPFLNDNEDKVGDA